MVHTHTHRICQSRVIHQQFINAFLNAYSVWLSRSHTTQNYDTTFDYSYEKYRKKIKYIPKAQDSNLNGYKNLKLSVFIRNVLPYITGRPLGWAISLQDIINSLKANVLLYYETYPPQGHSLTKGYGMMDSVNRFYTVYQPGNFSLCPSPKHFPHHTIIRT